MKTIQDILKSLEKKDIDCNEAEKKIAALYNSDLGFAQLDIKRQERTGYPEVIFCAGKTIAQSLSIIQDMVRNRIPVFATKASCELAEKVKSVFPQAEYDVDAKTISVGNLFTANERKGLVVVAAAGSSDLPVAKEAVLTAEFFGSNVTLITDIGVAGIHRLFSKLDEIRKARVVIAAAGMEGALASVVSGLVSSPVIALPTSVGYGASFGGITALLSMISSCAPGISVVNIDNGFGAGYQANLINRGFENK